MTDARWRLRPIQSRGLPREIAATAEGVCFGRDPSSDIVVPGDHFPHVSGRHMQLRLVDGAPVVEDLRSKNGTTVNGEVIVGESTVANGDIIQLGELGPRFLVVDASAVADTATVSFERVERQANPKTLGDTAIVKMRQALGIDPNLNEAMRRRGRRNLAAVLVIFVVLGAGATYGFLYLKDRSDFGDSRFDELDRKVAENYKANRQLMMERDEQIAQARRDLDEHQRRLDAQRLALETERDVIVSKIQAVADDRRSEEQLTALRRELDGTNRKLGLFDPVNLTQRKLADVRRVREAIVFIEVAVVYRERKSKKLFFLERDDKTGRISGNLEGRGLQFRRESSGSGFGVSKDGWILTCGHVVLPTGHGEVLPYGKKNPLELVPEVELSVVYSGTDRRYPATLHTAIHDDRDDIALIKVKPFPGMKFIEGFRVDPVRLEPGSDVYLFGFPLGKHTIQEGDRMIASTFRGILSRYVDHFIQIDAAVHPGNSGGPLTDEAGNVIGIVSRVQANPEDGGIVADIGYVLPIDDVAKIWPPK